MKQSWDLMLDIVPAALLKNILFIYGCSGSSSQHMGFSLVGLLSHCDVHAYCGGFSCGAQTLGHASFSSCGS